MFDNDATQTSCRTYNAAEHAIWRHLVVRQTPLVHQRGCREYLDGLARLPLSPDAIADLDAVDIAIARWTDWRFVPVTGFLPPRVFFRYLEERRFPIRVTMRGPDELDFAMLPDMFHDYFGHGPQVMNPTLASLMESFSRVVARNDDDDQLLAQISKLFWITFEAGLLRETGGVKVCGGAILSSRHELANIFEPNVRTHPLDMNSSLSTDYEPRLLQPEYVVIESYEQVLSLLYEIEKGTRQQPVARLG